MTGSIGPPPPITIASVFYPTNYPRLRHPKVGLVASEERVLSELAKNFENYTQVLPLLDNALTQVRNPA